MKLIKYVTIGLFFVACKNSNEPNGKIEIPTEKHTIWTEKTELFVEFPALIVGEKSRFATHLTRLNDHQPIGSGELKISLLKNGKGIESKVDNPSSAGIFTPTLVPQKSGLYQLVFDIKADSFSDRIVMRNVQVFENSKTAIAALSKMNDEHSGGITFLKEQAWKMSFKTEIVTKSIMREAVSTVGIWRTPANQTSTQTATVTGTINFVDNLLKGTKVKKGDLLMTLSSENFAYNNLSSELEKARIKYNNSRADFERKKALFEAKIITQSEYEKVQQKYLLAKADYKTLQLGYAKKGKKVFAPFDGFVQNIWVENGDFAEQGKPLITLSKNKSKSLEVLLNSSYADKLSSLAKVWYKNEQGKWSGNTEIEAISKEVSSQNPMLLVFVKVNDSINKTLGTMSEVVLEFGEPELVVSIPESAILEDYGKYAVIVQLEGERFEKRDVKIGKQNGDKVEIVKGLSSDEIIVTEGAFQIKMASLSGQVPEHGHAH